MKSGRGRGGGGGRLQMVVVLNEIDGISTIQGPAARLVDGLHRRGRILLLAEHPSEVPRHRPGILRRYAHTTHGDGHTVQRTQMIIAGEAGNGYGTGPRRRNDGQRTDSVGVRTTYIVSYLGNADGRGEHHHRQPPRDRGGWMERTTDAIPIFEEGNRFLVFARTSEGSVRALVWKI